MSDEPKKKPQPETESQEKLETPPEFDPLEAQAERLPDSIKGSEGSRPHVMDVTDDDDMAGVLPEEMGEDALDPDESLPDPAKFTAD